MFKRAFDLSVAGVGLVVLGPLFALIAIGIKLDSPGPVFYCGERVGCGGRLFKIFKFRTMVANAAQIGPGITSGQDARVTRVGRFLRRIKLDEFPQLINVLRGDMSLVGPRPEDPRYVALYSPEQRRILDYRPGITSLASLHYQDEAALLHSEQWEQVYINRIMPHKLAIDMDYLEHANLMSDLAIIMRTLGAIFR